MQSERLSDWEQPRKKELNPVGLGIDPVEHAMRHPEEMPVKILIRTIKMLHRSENHEIVRGLRYAMSQALEETEDEQRRDKDFRQRYRTRR